jgi:hypothetical protein
MLHTSSFHLSITYTFLQIQTEHYTCRLQWLQAHTSLAFILSYSCYYIALLLLLLLHCYSVFACYWLVTLLLSKFSYLFWPFTLNSKMATEQCRILCVHSPPRSPCLAHQQQSPSKLNRLNITPFVQARTTPQCQVFLLEVERNRNQQKSKSTQNYSALLCIHAQKVHLSWICITPRNPSTRVRLLGAIARDLADQAPPPTTLLAA